MRQVLQNLSNGETLVAEVPAPKARPGTVVIRSEASLVSVGTERMLVGFGKAGLIEKARQQPDKVRQVVTKARTEGLATTVQAVRAKLDQPMPLGYCNAGVVLAVGEGVPGLGVGDRVVSNGPHAEVVRVPHRLCARIPDEVSSEQAAFTVLASIGLQGIRLAEPTLGETVAVSGLGLIGLLTVQMLTASGCRVIGLDIDPERCRLAASLGAEVADLSSGVDPVAFATRLTGGVGVDAVIVTAATQSSDPIHQAAGMCRQRGRIVLVGATGLELNRADFYAKELSFQVSCSYGPGRYDPAYEDGGHDYPVGFVRWTEQRNFEAVLGLLGSGRLDVGPLISRRCALAEAPALYDDLAAGASLLGVILEYPRSQSNDELLRRSVDAAPSPRRRAAPSAAIGLIGAGAFASRVLGPAFAAAGAGMRAVCSDGGVTASHLGKKLGFERVTTDSAEVIDDPGTDAVVIATRHDSHAALVLRALKAGKAVFVEKPLALTLGDVDAIEEAWEAAGQPLLMVGFNRRFAPHTQEAKRLLSSCVAPKAVICTVNAGPLPPDHWLLDPASGGGRIVGEGCHFIDLVRHLVGAPIVSWDATAALGPDDASIALRFDDGSIGTVHYLGTGDKGFPKERIEVFCENRVLQIDNFRKLTGWGWGRLRRRPGRGQDKGHQAEAAAFVAALRAGGPPPIPPDELFEVSRRSIEIGEQLRS